MKQRLIGIIPKKYRVKGVGVALTIFARALLNFVGLAALLPMLYIILDSENMHSNPFLGWLYRSMGFTSDISFVVTLSVILVLFIVVKSLINVALYRYERDYIYSLYRHLSRNLFIGYFARGLQFLKGANSAVLARNVNVVCYTFVVGVLRPMATIACESALLLMIFISIALYSPIAALLSVAVFIPSAWLYHHLMRLRLNLYGKEENEAQRTKYRNVVESYRGFADIEINNAFEHQVGKFDNDLDTIIRVGRKNATISMLPQNFTEVGLAVGLALLVSLSVGFDSDNMKILFGVFAVAALRILPSIRTILSAWSALRYNRYTVDVLSENAAEEISLSPQSKERISFKQGIELRDVSFRFEDSDHDTIDNFSLNIKKGEKVGINGESGVGKTTLLNLMLGLYTPTKGEILVDGKALQGERVREWQNGIGYVSQSIFLADDTLLANIAFGCDEGDIDMERIKQAVEAASLAEFVAALPNGLHTRIGECGALLSGGQRQRIGIARALYKRADILFFDEATSSLDNATEQSINSAIEQLSADNENLTIVVVAHRESSLAYCDRVITIER